MKNFIHGVVSGQSEKIKIFIYKIIKKSQLTKYKKHKFKQNIIVLN